MYYLFACSEVDKEIHPNDLLLARETSSAVIKLTSNRINACEWYIMNSNDVVIKQSWKETNYDN